MESNKKSVGELITEARENVGITKNQLAEKAKVSHTEIARIESGEREVPNPKTLRKISKYIGINYNDLMYAAGLGAKVSPLNPYLIKYYDNLKGDELENTIKSIGLSLKRNKILLDALKKSSEDNTLTEEERNEILETIEDLEYQNDTNEDIFKLIGNKAIENIIEGKDNENN
jgi:Predicted transcription factor, homolog of eukaryotic MBF1